jgi:hypothetical protein
MPGATRVGLLLPQTLGDHRVRIRSVATAALMAATVLAGCGSSKDMQLYPTAGPLATQSPPPVIVAKASNTKDNSGDLAFRIPDGPRCKGTWTTVAPRVQSRERGISLSIRDLGGRLGRSSETVAGVNSGELYAVCRDGTVVQGTFVMGSGTTSGTGTATDTLGNSYKVLF